MQRSLFEQLLDANKNLDRMTPGIWYDVWPDQNHGIVHGATLVNNRKSCGHTDISVDYVMQRRCEMKKVLSMATPVGEGTIDYGEFQPGDGRKKEYHCWFGGCGIGGRSKTLEGAKKHLDEYLKDRLIRRKNKLEQELADIVIFLRSM